MLEVRFRMVEVSRMLEVRFHRVEVSRMLEVRFHMVEVSFIYLEISHGMGEESFTW